MNFLKYIISLIVACTGLWACYDDKGNYDYRELDEIVIDSTGGLIQADYSIARMDVLDIPLKVYYKGKLVNGSEAQYPELEFSWVVYQQGMGTPIADRDTVAEQIELKIPVELEERNWELVFTVLNKQTNTREFMKFGLKVNAALSEGWMVLYERDGKTDVGLIVDKLIAPNVTREQTWVDIYSTFNDVPLDGKPVRLLYSVSTNPQAVIAVTDKDMVGVAPSSFSKLYSFNDMFWTTPSVQAPDCYTAFYNKRELVMNDGKMHTVNFSTSGANRTNLFFGVPCTGVYGKLAKWCANMSSGYSGVVYDQENRKFMCIKSNRTEVVALPIQSAGIAFDCNDVGLELVMSDYGWSHYEYVIMKDGQEHYYLLAADFCSIMTQNMIGVGKYDMANCKGLSDGISSMTAGYKGEILYYAAGSKVYLYDYKSTNSTGDAVWEDPKGDEVTCIRLQKYYQGSMMMANTPPNACEVLYIATYNEQEGKGTVYQLRVNPSSGAVDLSTQKPFYGFGKVKDMGWKIK
ncbi:PKD-like family lipoprotein [Butyricimonas sp. Marseille-P3923]|uniref:PKD-like family lipoprotein n=1 Tax=Butyricimonas sp. Marseille-P3923 TaxID=1987504 RepID=UPI000C08BA7B|nr:PKD-like family lipoprotein [Butyricimonas sp. Marseille-P3923]